MTLQEQLGASLRKVSQTTYVWETTSGHAHPATELERKMWELLRSLTQDQQ